MLYNILFSCNGLKKYILLCTFKVYTVNNKNINSTQTKHTYTVMNFEHSLLCEGHVIVDNVVHILWMAAVTYYCA